LLLTAYTGWELHQLRHSATHLGENDLDRHHR
jgi:hypothetical protein